MKRKIIFFGAAGSAVAYCQHTKTKPDLILMDIGLSGDKDGIETSELINKDYDIPILFMTGNSDHSTIERAKATNPIDILLKPIDEGRLRNKLLQLKNS